VYPIQQWQRVKPSPFAALGFPSAGRQEHAGEGTRRNSTGCFC